jgi:DNA-binding protein YbaB
VADVEGRPDWNILRSMVSDLRKATDGLPDLQKRMLTVTGSAQSSDGLIKVLVGPRGHLLELEIDPRALRQPNSKALAASIVQTVREAVEEVGERNSELLRESLPADLRARQMAGTDMVKLLRSHDADVRIKEDDDG